MTIRALRDRHQESVSFRGRRRILVLSLLSLLIIVGVLLSLRPAFASGNDDGDGVLKINRDDIATLQRTANKQDEYLLRLSYLFESKSESQTGAGVPSLLYQLMGTPGTIGYSGNKACMTLGLILVLAGAAGKMLQILQREDEALDELLRVILVTCLGFALVIYSYDLLSGIETIGTTLYSQMSESLMTYQSDAAQLEEGPGTAITASTETQEDEIPDEDAEVSTVDKTSSKVASVIVTVLLMVTFYAIVAAAYGLIFELILRKMFAPIAFADFVSEGFRSPGAKYLKNFLGVYIRMMLFALLVVIGWAASRWALANWRQTFQINTVLGPIGSILCIRLAVKALLSSSGQLVKEMVGG